MRQRQRQFAMLTPVLLLVGGLFWLLSSGPGVIVSSDPVFSSFLSPVVDESASPSPGKRSLPEPKSSVDLPEVVVAPTSETARAADVAQELPQAFALSLVDRDGNPISQASIKIYRRPRFHFANLDPSVMAADMIGDVVSNVDGLSGFAAEDGFVYDLAIKAEGFAARRYRLTDPGTKRIVLRRKASVWGHVWDETGEPLAGVPVELEHDQGVFLRALTAADGQFEFKNVVPTAATLRIQSPTHRRDWRQIVVEGGTRHYREFFLKNGQTMDVTVVDDSGRPIEDASVDLVELNSGLTVASLQTNQAGGAQFGAIAPQSSYLVSVDGGVHGLARQMAPTASSTQLEHLSMTIAMGQAWNITGKLLSQDGIPIAGAFVVLECALASSGAFDSRHRVTVTTDQFGQFDSGALLSDGNYTVLAYHPNFASTVSTGWTPLSSNGLVMTMGFPNSIFGTIFGPTGEGVPNAIVFLTVGGAEPGTAGSVLVAQTGNDGGYQFSNVAAGNVSLEAISLLDNGSTGSVSMTVGDGTKPDGSLGVGGDAGASGRVNIQIKN